MTNFLLLLVALPAFTASLLAFAVDPTNQLPPQEQSAASAAEARTVIEAVRYGVSSVADPASNRKALARAFEEATSLRGPATVTLPPGEIVLDGDVVLDAVDSDLDAHRKQVTVKGAGHGQNGTWLRFRSGSLRIHSANHVLSDFRITSIDSDALIIEAKPNPTESAPARSMMENVRAEDSRGSGIVMSGNWIYLMQNVYARNNRGWGVEGRNGSGTYQISANAWTIIGGEFQGNGSAARGRPGSSAEGKGAGGGVYTGRAVQFVMVGSVIEGNRGDGLKIGEQARGIGLYNVYFEKNGSHPANRDILNEQPSKPGMGPSSVVIVGSNFTPIENQERAIELWDTQGLHIVSPQFFGSPGSHYSQEFIRLRESTPGRSTGWIETPFTSWSGYNQNIVLNETNRFGWPTRTSVSPNLRLAGASQGASSMTLLTIPVSEMAGRQIDVKAIVSANDWDAEAGQNGTTGVAILRTIFRRGPLGTRFSEKTNRLEFRAPGLQALGLENSSASDLAGTRFVAIGMARDGTAPEDTLPGPIIVLSVEATTFEPVVGH